MPIVDELERKGVADLLLQEPNLPILEQIAKSLTKNVIEIGSGKAALDIVFQHIPSVQALLNKKAITKEVLFKYAHGKHISLVVDFTKAILINKIIDFWGRDGLAEQPAVDTPHNGQLQETEYPIHLLARKFTEWFFENYNVGMLKPEDFWRDARLSLRIAANDCVNDQLCDSAEQVVDALLSCKDRFSFFFNPNLTHDGVQGRMDVHGLVIVLVCGTLHTLDNCVGVFETSFGLMRDPFAQNNWKVKTVQSLLRSQGAPREPRLVDSDTLKASLALPAPTGEIA